MHGPSALRLSIVFAFLALSATVAACSTAPGPDVRQLSTDVRTSQGLVF